jgi:hypothetical protein
LSISPYPSIAVTLAINPPAFALGSDVEISVTAVTNVSYPITIFTWPHVFNLGLAQRRGNFEGWDRDTGMELPMREIAIDRASYDHRLGGRDDEFHVTLEPGKPIKFSPIFFLAHGLSPHMAERRAEGKEYLAEGDAELLPGRRYLLDIREDHYDSEVWWKKGRKEDALDLIGRDSRGLLGSLSH